jgi:hypothetical protein
MQKIIAASPNPIARMRPEGPEQWKSISDAAATRNVSALPGLRERLQVQVEKMEIDGVRGFVVTPEILLPQNSNRLLIHIHGGCYVLSPGEAGLPEALLMAGLGLRRDAPKREQQKLRGVARIDE